MASALRGGAFPSGLGTELDQEGVEEVPTASLVTKHSQSIIDGTHPELSPGPFDSRCTQS